MAEQIRPEIEDLAIPLDDVQPHPENPRRGDIPLIKESLTENQQYRPLLVQTSSGNIIAGNNTWRAAKEAGWGRVAVRWLDIDDDRARRIAAVDNRANDLATYDNQLLADWLRNLPDLSGTGWTGSGLDDVLAELDETAPSESDNDGETQQHRDLKDKKESFFTSDYRSIVLSYEGDQYVVVLQLLTEASGESPPES